MIMSLKDLDVWSKSPEGIDEIAFRERCMKEPLDLLEKLSRPQGTLGGALDEFDEQDVCASFARDVMELKRAFFTFAGPGERLTKELVKELPAVPAVYWLNCPLDSNCNRWRIVYIGKARDLNHRWHHAKHHRFDQATTHDCRLQWWQVTAGVEALIEAALIYELKPAWNERD